MNKAHFIGICGAGMSAVAKLLMEHGWSVTGSDEGFYPPISTYLEANNIPCIPHYDPANIPPDADIIVIGKHAKLVPDENSEVKAAFSSGIVIKSFPEILNELTAPTKNYVVAGSFGKSTCAALTAWALTSTNQDPSYFIGAIGLNLPTNAHAGQGKAFVLEGDEYPSANWDTNSKFLYYNASTVLITSAEHDHINVFPTLESYTAPFVQLLMQVPIDGLIVACLDGANIADVLTRSGRTAVTYSLNNNRADWYAGNINRVGIRTTFNLMFRGELIGEFKSNLLGDHNIQNMVGVAAFLLCNRAIEVAQLISAFEQFKGVKRRMELKTTDTIIPVYEDFGSSRAKAMTGIQTIRRQFPSGRVIVIFEPHTFSFRNRDTLFWYDDLFSDADIIFIYQPPIHGATTHDQLTQAEIVDRVRNTGKDVYAINSKEELIEKLKPLLAPGDIILIETSGDIGGSIEAVTNYVNQTYPR